MPEGSTAPVTAMLVNLFDKRFLRRLPNFEMLDGNADWFFTLTLITNKMTTAMMTSNTRTPKNIF